jgi:hypothetical protein
MCKSMDVAFAPLLVCIAWLDEVVVLAGDNDIVKATANDHNMLMNDMALSCGVESLLLCEMLFTGR